MSESARFFSNPSFGLFPPLRSALREYPTQLLTSVTLELLLVPSKYCRLPSNRCRPPPRRRQSPREYAWVYSHPVFFFRIGERLDLNCVKACCKFVYVHSASDPRKVTRRSVMVNRRSFALPRRLAPYLWRSGVVRLGLATSWPACEHTHKTVMRAMPTAVCTEACIMRIPCYLRRYPVAAFAGASAAGYMAASQTQPTMPVI